MVGCTPDTPQSRAAAGKELVQKKDYKAAVVQFKSALQLDPESAEGRFLLGKALLEGGDMAGAEIELVAQVAREYRLSRAIDTLLTDRPFEYVFLDCPPSLGLLTLNGLVAAREVLLPIQCE